MAHLVDGAMTMAIVAVILASHVLIQWWLQLEEVVDDDKITTEKIKNEIEKFQRKTRPRRHPVRWQQDAGSLRTTAGTGNKVERPRW